MKYKKKYCKKFEENYGKKNQKTKKKRNKYIVSRTTDDNSTHYFGRTLSQNIAFNDDRGMSKE